MSGIFDKWWTTEEVLIHILALLVVCLFILLYIVLLENECPVDALCACVFIYLATVYFKKQCRVQARIQLKIWMSLNATIHDVIYLFINKTKWNWTAQIPSTLSSYLSVFMWRSFRKSLHLAKCFQQSRRDFCCVNQQNMALLRKPVIFHGIL